MKSHLNLTIQVDPGTNIDTAFAEAVGLATKLGCKVMFNFNDVHCFANPKGDAQQGVTEYHESIQKLSKYAFAR